MVDRPRGQLTRRVSAAVCCRSVQVTRAGWCGSAPAEDREPGGHVATKKFAMMARAGTTRTDSRAGPERTRHVLLRDDLGQLTLRRLRPWRRVLARCAAARLDRELAAGTSPESSAGLAARAMALTSTKVRRELAASLQRILAAAGQPQAAMLSPAAAARRGRIPVNRGGISQSAVPLAELAGCLAAPGPVQVQGVAMLSQLLADGTGPLYHDSRGDDLGAIIEQVTRALSLLSPANPATPISRARRVTSPRPCTPTTPAGGMSTRCGVMPADCAPARRSCSATTAAR